MVSKIPYNKKLDGTKQWGSGGPRDVQRKQNLAYGSAVIQLPSMSVEELKRLLGDSSPIGKDTDDMTFEEVRKKIDEAVQFTINQERKRYESGLKSLNNQLNDMRRKIVAAEEQLVEKNAEIKKLRYQVINDPQNLDIGLEKNNDEINSLKIKIEEKDRVIENLSNNYNNSINILRNKIDDIDNKLSRGIITSNEYKSESNRPKIEDDVFIDPIEDGNLELDPHIEIEPDSDSSVGVNRNIKEDLNKLRRLLNKSEDGLVK